MTATKTFTMQGEPTGTRFIDDPTQPNWSDHSAIIVDSPPEDDTPDDDE